MPSTFDNILAIESSGSLLRLGLLFGGDRMVKSQDDDPRTHSQTILKRLGDLFNSAGLAHEQIDAVVVGTGPGSFTGLRIGIAVAKGIAEALTIPIIGISLFDIAAARLSAAEAPVLIVAPLKRDEVLVGLYRDGAVAADSIRPVAIADLAREIGGNIVTTCGVSLEDLVPGLKLDGQYRPIEYDAGDLIHLGRVRLERGERGEIVVLEPLYVQKSQAEINFERRQRRSE